MALLFLKSLVFPHATGRYSPLPPNSPLSDMERGHPTSSDASQEKSTEQFSAYEDNSRLARVNPRVVSDAIIGLSDGLTVPFALTAGLSALGDNKVVIYGGLAELIAGGISMGLGGYLGAKSEAEAYQAALSETKEIVANDGQKACSMVRATFRTYDFDNATLDTITSRLQASETQMVDFLMRFHHALAEADYAPSRAYVSGLTISAGYFFGGLVPLLPYLFASDIRSGFVLSVLVMAAALFVFGWAKTSLVGEKDRWVCAKSGVQMVLMGGIAAGAAMGCVKTIGG